MHRVSVLDELGGDVCCFVGGDGTGDSYDDTGHDLFGWLCAWIDEF